MREFDVIADVFFEWQIDRRVVVLAKQQRAEAANHPAGNSVLFVGRKTISKIRAAAWEKLGVEIEYATARERHLECFFNPLLSSKEFARAFCMVVRAFKELQFFAKLQRLNDARHGGDLCFVLPGNVRRWKGIEHERVAGALFKQAGDSASCV